mgnify:CR=1 FL=1
MTRKQAKPQINPFLKLGLELGPLVLFFFANQKGDLFLATSVFMVAVLPQFLDPARPLWLQLLICSATSVVIDLIVMRLGYAHVAAGLQRLMKRPSARRVRDRLFGGVLMALGGLLAACDRRYRSGSSREAVRV